MANRIVEGIWDCRYCGTNAIGGLTKHCPCCGHPQDEDVQFYLGEEKKYLEEEVAAQYGQGADWVCGYCGALNRVHFKYCATCGGAKDSSEKDYFQAKDQQAARAAAKQTPPPPKKKSKLPMILALIAVLLVAFFMWPRTTASQVQEKSWTRTVDIQVERTVQEDDWQVPDGGRLLSQAQAIHHYNDVLDHYETRTREVAERVLDHYDTSVSYSNNGDGTFTEVEHQTPVYRTEYHTETYQEPIYVKVPQYATKYTYEIERWFYDRTETASGGADEPHWPELKLTDKEREAGTTETYTVTATDEKEKSFTFEMSLEKWQGLNLHDSVKLTTVGGRVTKVNDKPLK